MTRSRDDQGSALVELVWLGILLLVPLLWIVVSVFDVQRGAFGTESAARSAARAYALAPDDASGRERARAAARQALADQGLDDAPVEVEVDLRWAGRLPQRHLRHHGARRLPGRPAADAGRARRGSAQLRARPPATPCPIGQYQEITR